MSLHIFFMSLVDCRCHCCSEFVIFAVIYCVWLCLLLCVSLSFNVKISRRYPTNDSNRNEQKLVQIHNANMAANIAQCHNRDYRNCLHLHGIELITKLSETKINHCTQQMFVTHQYHSVWVCRAKADKWLCMEYDFIFRLIQIFVNWRSSRFFTFEIIETKMIFFHSP